MGREIGRGRIRKKRGKERKQLFWDKRGKRRVRKISL